MPTPKKRPATPTTTAAAPTRTGDVLDVAATARLLTVSVDTVYDLFAAARLAASGSRPGRRFCAGSRAALPVTPPSER